MNKNDYLKRLAKLLHMLKEDEVNDIIAEYEQHIDMKIAEGMSEEEAVQAFGTVEELAADILDAYHVKPDFKEKKEVFEKVQSESKKAMKNAGEAGKGFFAGVKSKILSILEFCKKGCKKMISVCKKVILAPFVFFKGIFAKKEKDVQESVNVTEKVKKKRGVFSMILSFIKGVIRLFRKIFYGFLLLFFGSCSIALILALGFLTVLLLLGYPIVGITLSTLGIAMSASAVTYFAVYRWRRV